jgi:hypothetical protein
MAAPIRYRATLKPTASAACYVDFPYDLKATYGKGNLVPVVVLWDDRVTYRGAIAKMGGEHPMILCRTDVVTALDKRAGDEVEVYVVHDLEPRLVELPEIAAGPVAANPAAQATWDGLSASCRREYANWILEAKRPDTQRARVESVVALLTEGKKRRR